TAQRGDLLRGCLTGIEGLAAGALFFLKTLGSAKRTIIIFLDSTVLRATSSQFKKFPPRLSPGARQYARSTQFNKQQRVVHAHANSCIFLNSWPDVVRPCASDTARRASRNNNRHKYDNIDD